MDAKCAKRNKKTWTTNFCKSFFKNIFFYIIGRLSNIRSVHTLYPGRFILFDSVSPMILGFMDNKNFIKFSETAAENMNLHYWRTYSYHILIYIQNGFGKSIVKVEVFLKQIKDCCWKISKQYNKLIFKLLCNNVFKKGRTCNIISFP